MNYNEIRRLFLKAFIGFLSLTALVAIISVLSRQFGHTQLKVLVTTFSISAASICAMSGAAFLERKGPKAIGLAGIAAAGVAVLMVIGGVWGEVSASGYWKVTFTSIVAAAAFAHGSLLRLPNLAVNYRWTQRVSTILIVLLAGQIILAVCGEIKHEEYYRAMAALSVLVVLITLVIPICGRLKAEVDGVPAVLRQVPEGSDQIPERLILRRVSGSIFADQAGRCFRVAEVRSEAARI